MVGSLFQSTLPYGSDTYATTTTSWVDISIHAPSRERPLKTYTPSILFNFNPRSLTGATRRKLAAHADLEISIHAPSRERRGNPAGDGGGAGISIHAPSRERPPIYGNAPLALISIHAPSRERPGLISTLSAWSIFQSTLPHGSDQTQNNPQMTAKISIHAPSRERPCCRKTCPPKYRFQSTLPHGSDPLYCKFSHYN